MNQLSLEQTKILLAFDKKTTLHRQVTGLHFQCAGIIGFIASSALKLNNSQLHTNKIECSPARFIKAVQLQNT